jgi:hypothetical protein
MPASTVPPTAAQVPDATRPASSAPPVAGRAQEPPAAGGPAGGSAGGEAAAGTGVPLRGILETVGLVVAPTSLVTALLFYFGWARAGATYDYFGIDRSTLGFSVQDYLVRSVSPTFEPLALLMLVALAALWAHGALVRALRTDPHRFLLDRVWLAAMVAGGLLLAVGLSGMLDWVLYLVSFPLVPVSLGGGLVLIAYGASLRARSGRRVERPAVAAPLRGLRLALTGTLVVVTLFWTVASSAQASGRQLGRGLAANLWSLPDATVFSAQRLHLAGPGVREVALGAGATDAYRFRYTGLTLMVRADGKWFLLPAGWTRQAGAAILLPDRDDLRVELAPGRRAPPSTGAAAAGPGGQPVRANLRTTR